MKHDVFRNVTGFRLSYLRNVVMMLGRIDRHIQDFGYNVKVSGKPLVANTELATLSLAARSYEKQLALYEASKHPVS